MVPTGVGRTKRGHCPVCNKPNENENMVTCNNCKRLFCHECVNVSAETIIDPKSWLCSNCNTNVSQQANAGSSEQMFPTATETIQQSIQQLPSVSSLRKSKSPSKHSLNVSGKTPSASSSKRKLKLRLIQEELALLRKERELTKEARLIMGESDDSQELDDEEIENVDPLLNSLLSLQIEQRVNTNISKPQVAVETNQLQPQQHSLKQDIRQADPKFSTQRLNQNINDFTYENLERTILTPQQCAARKTTPRELPIFTGNSYEWPLFISSFRRSTQLCGFDNCENLLRLQQSLKGSAKSIVISLLTVPECVPEIISTLEMLFGRPEQILEAHINLIRRQPPPKAEKIETLVEYALAVKNLCVSLQNANMHAYFNNPTLMYELLDKLPPQIKVNWAIHRSTLLNFNGLQDLGDWLHNIALNVCTALPSLTILDRNKSARYREPTNLHTAEPEKQPKKCKICSGNCSFVSDCKTFQGYPIEDKWKFVKELKLCRLCLKRHRFPCKYPVKCSKNECQRKHHPLLHKDIEFQQLSSNTSLTTPNVQETVNVNLKENYQSIRFRILPVRLENGGKEILTYAFMDEGSSITMLDESIAAELGLHGDNEPLCLKWTGEQERLEENSQKVLFTISGDFHGARQFENRPARTVRALNLPKQSLNATNLVKDYKYLKNVPLKSYTNVIPKLLIGLDNWDLALPLQVKEGDESQQPIAAKCRLGWTVFALYPRSNLNYENIYFFCGCNRTDINNQELHQIINKYFSVESLGISPPTKSILSSELKRASEIMESTIKQNNSGYEIGLIWKFDYLKLPDSRGMAIQRLNCIEKRMRSDPELASKMNQQIQDFIQKGYIRKLTADELRKQYKRIWYLPIFPAFNPNKPNKFRIVWDAAAKVDGISLNSMLLKGDDQLSSLLGILLRVRENKVAFSGDIKEMFLRVKISGEDQHAQRFLWRDGNSNNPIDTYVMTVMTFGATCSPSCAQYVKNVNARKYIEEFPRAVTSIVENHYVDDLLDSTDTVQMALTLAKEVRFIHSKANYEIRNWRSNSEEFMQIMNSTTENPSKINMNMETEHVMEKVLGMWWNLKSDSFTYSLRFNKGNVKVLKDKERPTKREVLRILMSIYDPLGFIAHFLIYLKILLQEIWRSKIGWDDLLTDEQFEKWLLWLHYLPAVETLEIPRCYLHSFPNWYDVKAQLHIFVDASENSMACVAYLRMEKDGNIETTLVGSKTRVAPIKIQTIPRLELDAAVIGARFANNICSSLSISISQNFYWSDSVTVLRWIRTEDPRKLGKAVAYRVAEIQENSMVSNWRYVPTKINSADEATKWSKQPSLRSSTHWFTGPDFLCQDSKFWPADVEMIDEFTHDYSKPLIEVERFSNYNRLLYAMGTVFRFINLILANFRNQIKPTGGLTSEELKNAENCLIRMVQNSHYSAEIIQLQKTGDGLQPSVKKSSGIYKLSPYLDSNNILRVRGRIDAAKFVEYDLRRPIILPRVSHLTLLIIRKYHVAYQHQNHETVVNEIRQKYYIPKLRRSLLKIRQNCPSCKLRIAKPIIPEMSPLPDCRLAVYSAPFTYTAVDYFGPINVSVGRRIEKRWGALFSCLTTRAVHMELAHKLNADSFILCLKNFMNRRGQPRYIHCDRGSNFIAAERILREELHKIDPELIAKSFASPQISFKFNSPLSPHMAGSWERLVKAVKIALYGALTMRTPTDPLLVSCLIAAENIVNTRPLTYLPLDSEESEALTPNHFLMGSSSGDKPLTELDDSSKTLKHCFLYREQFANRYWTRFVAEYIPELLLRSKWHKQTSALKEGDIIIICDKDLPRCNWPKGRILEVTKGTDGQVRRAKVQTVNGIYERPALKLAKLCINNSKDGVEHSPGSATPGGSVQNA